MSKMRWFAPLALLLLATQAWAMPMFARRYGMECTACHNPIPRLNETGYKFRAAGYRMPDDIGKTESPTKFGDFAAARIQFSFVSAHAKRAAATRAGTDSLSWTNSNQLRFQEFTFYPLSMSFAKNWGSLVELSNEPDGVIEVENAYLRFDQGSAARFWEARAGVMHPFEGYGASDRPISISRPLFETFSPTSTAAYYTTWGIDQMGVEAGVDMSRTSLRATLFNGTVFKDDEGKSVGAIGGSLVKPSGSPSFNSKDFQIFANQILTAEGSGVSALFYHGTADLGPELAKGFNRLAGFASYAVNRIHLQGGVQYGTDQTADTTGVALADTSLKSLGFFAGADYGLSDNLYLGARFDQFDPNTGLDHHKVQALTAFANAPLNNGIQFLAQYQYRAAQRGRYTDVDEVRRDKAHNFELRVVTIW